MSIQYGHCVVRATATAISSLYFTGMAPSATASLSNSQKAFITSGARLFMSCTFFRLSLLYIIMVVRCLRFRLVPDCDDFHILGRDDGGVRSPRAVSYTHLTL